jgi:hypothetical protein
MTTVSAGSSATLTLLEGEQLTISTTGGRGSVTVMPNGGTAVTSVFSGNAEVRIVGPIDDGGKVGITAVGADIDYHTGGGSLVTLNAAGTSLVDGAGNPILNQSYAVEIPSGLGWNSTSYPISLSLIWPPRNRCVGTATGVDEILAAHFATALAATPIYVDVSNGNDTTGNGTSGNKYATIDKAIQIANAAAVPSHVIVTGGGTREYQLSQGFNGSTRQPTVMTVFTASNGIVRSTTRYSASFSGTKDATFTNTYKAAISTTQIARLIALRRLKDGSAEGQDAIRVADAATCNATPGSYAVVSTDLYYNPVDGIAPVAANTAVYQAGVGNFRAAAATPVSIWLRCESDRDSWLLEGGSTGSFRAVYSALPAQPIILAMDNTVLRFAGTRDGVSVNVGSPSRQLEVDGVHGLFVARNSHCGSSGADAWNIHRNLASATTYALLVNCTSELSGIPDPSAAATNTSNNGLTIHSDVILIDLAGHYAKSYGRTFYSINTSKALLSGTILEQSFGDQMYGGAFPPCEVALGNTSQVWMDRVEVRPVGGGFPSVAVDDTAILRTRNCLLPANKVAVASGATYTTY